MSNMIRHILHLAAWAVLTTVVTCNAHAALSHQTINPHIRYRQAMNRAGITGAITTQPHKKIQSDAHNSDAATYLPVIIKLSDANSPMPDFVNEMHRRGHLVLAQVPEDRIGELADYPHVVRVESQPSATPVMDCARTFCNLPLAIADATPLPLTGKNVVTGFCDIGFDPAHINFLDKDGNTRVRKVVQYTLEHPHPLVMNTQDEIMGWRTDNPDETHATHVCGIMSGSFDTNNYHGIATEADIVATVSPLYDAYLLDGCEQIIDYAHEKGKPAVINMSIASEIGPHDGTSLFNQYMDMLAEDAAVCISAGNSGNRKCYIERTFTKERPTVRTYPRQWPSWSPLEAHGVIDIWGNDGRPFNVDVVGWSETGQDIAYRWKGETLLDPGKDIVICSPDLAGNFPGHAEPMLPARFSGYIYLNAEVNPENGRYNVAFVCDIKDITTTDHYAAEYRFGPEITGSPGQSVEIYASSNIFFLSPTDPLSTNGDASRSVNDLCAGDNAICVGSMSSRDTWPMADGTTGSSDQVTVGAPSYFSSYGTLNNGIRPHICAPGAVIISSISKPYVNAHPDVAKSTSFIFDSNGTKYYWKTEQGTSMSSPFAAGTIALWLQANPDLTGKDLKDIVISTASAPATEPNNPQWGHGLLDAAAGLAKARELAHIDNVYQSASSDARSISIKKIGMDAFSFSWGSKSLSGCRIIDMSGREVKRQHTASNQPSVTIDCADLKDAIYIAEITASDGSSATGKFVITLNRK